MKYSVKVFLTCYKTVEVEADSHSEAIDKARTRFWDQPDSYRTQNLEFADDVRGFLVDEDGDEDYVNTQFYDQYGKPDTL